MAFLQLPVRSDFKDYRFQIELDGVLFNLRFAYNGRMDRWFMHVADANDAPLYGGIPVQVDVDNTSFYKGNGTNLPLGQFIPILVDDQSKLNYPGKDDLGNKVFLLYEEAT